MSLRERAIIQYNREEEKEIKDASKRRRKERDRVVQQLRIYAEYLGVPEPIWIFEGTIPYGITESEAQFLGQTTLYFEHDGLLFWLDLRTNTQLEVLDKRNGKRNVIGSLSDLGRFLIWNLDSDLRNQKCSHADF